MSHFHNSYKIDTIAKNTAVLVKIVAQSARFGGYEQENFFKVVHCADRQNEKNFL